MEEERKGRALELEEVLPVLQSVGAQLARRSGMSEAEAEDFVSWAIVRLLSGKCRALSAYRGASPVTVYLRRVVGNLFRDYRISLWGKWRPSEATKRLGPLAVELERLIDRDGRSPAEAVAIIELRESSATRAELEELLAALPARRPSMRRAPRPLESLAREPVATDDPERVLCRATARRESARLVSWLAELMRELDPLERRLLRRRFEHGARLNEIARELGLAPKEIYRMVARLKRRLRGRLEERGVRCEDVRLWLEQKAARHCGREVFGAAGAVEGAGGGAPEAVA